MITLIIRRLKGVCITSNLGFPLNLMIGSRISGVRATFFAKVGSYVYVQDELSKGETYLKRKLVAFWEKLRIC